MRMSRILASLGKGYDRVVYYFTQRDHHTELTGGWKIVNGTSSDPELSYTSSGALYCRSGSNTSIGDYFFATKKKIDLTHINTLYFRAKKANAGVVRYGIGTSQGSFTASVLASQIAEKTYSMNVSSRTGEYYLIVRVTHGMISGTDYRGATTVYEIRGER